MLDKIPYRFALQAMMVLLSLVLVFHLLVLFGVLPYEIVWAGKLKNESDMRSFELVSLAVNAIILLVIWSKANPERIKVPAKTMSYMLWLIVFIFSMNTLGNLFAETKLEALVFTPFTFVSAVLCMRIALYKQDSEDTI